MKLYYNILWFEDQPDQIINFIGAVERILTNNGFKLKLETKDSITPDDLDKLENDLKQYNPYDLIIFDHDLGNNATGAYIAKQLRHSVYTDMVYYSGNPAYNLRDELYNAQIDGVFIINRTDFPVSIERILEDHINKFSDMNNMRGVFLDAFSKIEQFARQSLSDTIENLSDDERKEILEKTKSYHRKKNKERSAISENLKVDDLCDHFFETGYVDFDFIRRRLSKLANHLPIWEKDNLVNQIQKLRNILAHCSYKFDPMINEVTITTSDGVEHFNIARFKEIRKKLIEIFTELGID